nr:lipopolysaccharide kinase InaA family protein [Anaerohalosphaera lusitana]
MNRLKLSGWKLFIDDGFPVDTLRRLPRGPHFENVRGPFERVNASTSARVFRCKIGFAGRPVELYFKQYLHRSVTDFLKHAFRPSRAVRSLKAAKMLAEHDLNAPPVVAVGELKLGPFVLENFTFTEAVNHAPDLYEHVQAFAKSSSHLERRSFIEQLGETIGRMHATNISHGDLRPGNVLARKTDDRWQFFFLDNERTRKYMRIPRKLILKNLVQINMLHSDVLSSTDRMRFFKAYLRSNPKLVPERKLIARKSAQRTAERLNKKKHK